MAQMLTMMPKNHSKRNELLDVYRRQMEALIKYQDKSGAWRQLIDYPDSWLETSGTSMFVFAITTGVSQGWLPEKPYLESARRGWLALANFVDDKGRLGQVCVGTSRRKTAEGYLIRPRKAGDPHGQGPLLWAAAAMIEMEKN
jgi:rhamnogalacturonyl hydrolase YesR